MDSHYNVILVSNDAQTVESAANVMRSSERIALTAICGDYTEAIIRLEQNPTAAVLVDIDTDKERMLQELEELVNRFTSVRFMILSESRETELILRAMQIGVRHCLLKQSLAEELYDALSKVMSFGSLRTDEPTGSIITLLTASGGCGATTLAINMANELSISSDSPCLLIDMDCSYGAIATYLGLKAEYGIGDVLSHKGKIDPQLIASSATTFDERLKVLASPASINFLRPRDLEYRQLAEAIYACKQSYKYTIIDAPRMALDWALKLVQLSNLVMIVFQQTVKDIKVVQQIRTYLMHSGIQPEKIMPIINRLNKKKDMVDLLDGQKSLGLKTIPCIRSDFASAVRSLNYGAPLAQVAPRSALRKDLCKLLNDISILKHTRDN